jgi:hypothetical protein
MYFVNRYRQDMPFLKKVLEDLRYRIRWFLNYYKNGKTIHTVLFYPHFPSKSTVLYKIFRSLNYNITNNPAKTRSLIIYWEDVTIRRENEVVNKLSRNERIINLKSIDISKSQVDKIFSEVFGYSSLVDPENSKGTMVRKSELNAAHDGIVFVGPSGAEPGFVYQKLINNQCHGNLVADMRIPVINGIIPLLFIKYKTLETRFGVFRKWHHKLKNVEVHKSEDLLNHDEITKLLEFCKRAGLDYGEIDVLRDCDDGRIYVVDVNNTPTGPPKMNKQEKKESIRIMTNIFEKEFISQNHNNPITPNYKPSKHLHHAAI